MNNEELLQIEITSESLKRVGDTLIQKVYLGQMDHKIKQGIIIKIYNKDTYNMLLVEFKGKIGTYKQCYNQYKDTYMIF